MDTAPRTSSNSFRSHARLDLGGSSFHVHRLDAVPGSDRLPVSHKILLENLLRKEDGRTVTADHVSALVDGSADGHRRSVPFFPSRVFLHDTNGVPVLTDLAALRDAVAAAGGDPRAVSPAIPGDLTVDHSISTEVSGRADASKVNTELEYVRHAERFRFLRWGERLNGLRVVPPGTGIMHQINLEFLASVVERRDGWAFPDTCVGTDSHTTMVNALGVLAWGVGGVEAEAALLGQPLDIVVPRVIGVELVGALPPGVTSTDLVLTVVEKLRAHGVVGSFVEFTGPAVAELPPAHRATVANMCPEFGATAAVFPIDRATLDYLRLTGRGADHVAAVETYAKVQGLWHEPGSRPRYDELLTIDLSSVTTSLAGPRRPQDRVPLGQMAANAATALDEVRGSRTDRSPGTSAAPSAGTSRPETTDGEAVRDGAVAIAAITSCTNTSNPHAMIAAGLLARNARARGLRTKPWVKTSLAPGSKTVTRYLHNAGLTKPLDELGFHHVGYGCMTCIGNSGPLLESAAKAVAESDTVLASVLSGNRNFDGRINNDVSLNYLASPALVVAYALAGSVLHDLTNQPLGAGADGVPVMLADLWPSDSEIEAMVNAHLGPELFAGSYTSVTHGDERWEAVPAVGGDLFEWPEGSTYLRRPPFLDGVGASPAPRGDITGARTLLLLGDSVTTDHISPAGRIPADSSAGRHLSVLGETELNTYASRRGNFDVMVRGAFANPRLRNLLAPAHRGGHTPCFAADGAVLPVYEAAQTYARAGTPLLVIAGKEYGTGSSRDWAAKGTALLKVNAVLAQSFERIHRSNLVQLGVLPLQFVDRQSAESLGLDGTEEFDVAGLAEAVRSPGSRARVRVRPRAGREDFDFPVLVRIDTEQEAEYYANGGILPYVYRRFVRDHVA
ncbi:aconitate hydratase AcnA [Streptomyces sp. AD681]|uniref:aconitate hydratase AcnA n=1 Tax=Streptomyces sp. AD681 TaxID=3019069 RepID=UPI0022F16FFC|nr:aconitate hydratase AcnA [Streptomyces sp. AD681]MDA5145667.1 aconitate hydratase AcnA [Streptomyces sp. AD681]